MYGKGQGVSQDYNEAVKWYSKAVEQGNINAQDNLKALNEEYEQLKPEKELLAELKKYHVKEFAWFEQLVANPFEFEGRNVATVVQFDKMFSRDTALFSSGNTNCAYSIMVSGIRKRTHFDAFAGLILVLKGMGTIKGTNAYGAIINTPHF